MEKIQLHIEVLAQTSLTHNYVCHIESKEKAGTQCLVVLRAERLMRVLIPPRIFKY